MVEGIKGIKWITIHGIGTIYRCSIFKFGGENEILRRAGYRDPVYVGMMIWGADPKIIVDKIGGYAPYALEKANLPNCSVLLKGWETILNKFDVIPDGGNIEITQFKSTMHARIEPEWSW